METEVRIEKVEEDLDNGWFTIHTSNGKFTTKIREKAQEANNLKGSQVTLHYAEKTRQSDGRTYTNRYYERASALGAPAGNGGIEQTAGARRTPPQDAWRMCLNKGGELAVATLPLMPNDQRGFDVQKTIAIAWAKFFFYTPLPERDGGSPPDPEQGFRNYASEAQQMQQQVQQATSYEHTDDNIPF